MSRPVWYRTVQTTALPHQAPTQSRREDVTRPHPRLCGQSVSRHSASQKIIQHRSPLAHQVRGRQRTRAAIRRRVCGWQHHCCPATVYHTGVLSSIPVCTGLQHSSTPVLLYRCTTALPYALHMRHDSTTLSCAVCVNGGKCILLPANGGSHELQHAS